MHRFAALPRSLRVTFCGRVLGLGLAGPDWLHPCAPLRFESLSTGATCPFSWWKCSTTRVNSLNGPVVADWSTMTGSHDSAQRSYEPPALSP